MKTLKYWLLSLVVACATGTVGFAETWQMPTPYPITSFHTVNIEKFAKDVEKATDGKLTIKVHPAGSLFKHADIKNAIRSGQVRIGEFLLSRLSNEDALFEIDSLPFVATDYEQSARLWASSKAYVQDLLARQGLVVLFAVPWPPQALYSSGPIETVDDLRGVKLRAYNKTQEQFARLAGAIPTQVEVPDIAQAFATGRVEAMITSPSTGANTRAWEFVSHYYNTQAWLPKNVVVASRAALDSLDEKTLQAVLDAAAAAEVRGWAMSEAETIAKVALLKKSGLIVADPNPELAAELRALGDKMVEVWLRQTGINGTAIMTRFRSEVKASR